MTTFFVNELPEGAVEAAEEFYVRVLPALLADLANPPSTDEHLLVVFDRAPHDHRAWMLAAIQILARHAAPRRVNGIVRAAGADFRSASGFVANAAGVTGQLLSLAPD